MKARVVITGLGALTPPGNGTRSTWQSLLNNVSGIGQITKFDASDFSCRIAGEGGHVMTLLPFSGPICTKACITS